MKVLAVEELATASGDGSENVSSLMMQIYGIGTKKTAGAARITSAVFAKLPVRVTLKVRFAVQSKEKP